MLLFVAVLCVLQNSCKLLSIKLCSSFFFDFLKWNYIKSKHDV